MSTKSESPSFDWVNERASCSVEVIFKQLQFGIEGDVKAANEVFLSSGRSFQLTCNDAKTSFSIFRVGLPQSEVRFSLSVNSISLKRGRQDFIITLTLNNEGRCKLRVDKGEELEQWQLRKMALEELFFV